MITVETFWCSLVRRALLIACTASAGTIAAIGAEVPPTHLPGGVYIFVLSGAYDGDPALNEKFAKAGNDFADHLRKVFPKEDRKEFIQLAGPDVNKKSLEDILGRIERIQDNSLVIFYFCGHGFRRGEKPLQAAPGAVDKRPTCLALFGCDPAGKVSNRDEVSLCTSRIAEVFDSKSNLNFMVFLDCCHAGTAVPLLTKSQTDSYAVDNRGMFLAASTADGLSYNCNFTNAVLKVWNSGRFANSETPLSLEAKVTKEMNGGEGVATQFAKHVLGNDALPLGLLSSDTCIVFLQLSPPPAPLEYFVSIEGVENPIQRSPGTTMLLLTAPRKNCAITISGHFKPWKSRVDFTGRSYYPLKVGISGTVATNSPTLSQQQAAVEADYEALIAQAKEQGLSLATVGIEPIRNALLSQPLIDSAPLVNRFLVSVQNLDDDSLADTELVKAMGYLVRNDPLPVTAEGRRLAVLLSKSGIGGEALISKLNYRCVDLIVKDPETAARDLGFSDAAEAKDNLVGFYSSGLRYALVSRNESLVRDEPLALLAKLRANPGILRKTDYAHIAKLKTVAEKTYKTCAITSQSADKPVDSRIVKRAADYQYVIKTTGVFTDSDYSNVTPSYLLKQLVGKIDKQTEVSYAVGGPKDDHKQREIEF